MQHETMEKQQRPERKKERLGSRAKGKEGRQWFPGCEGARSTNIREVPTYLRSAHAMTAVWARGPLVLATLGRFFADFLFVALIFQRAPQPSALDSRFASAGTLTGVNNFD